MKKAIGYVRVSTEEQVREGVSLEAQRAKIRVYCELKDLNLLEIISDEGISGKNLRRPGMQRVLKSAGAKEIDAIIVYKLDRMFRNTVDALETTRKFEKWGVSFHSIQETIDTKSAMGKFFFTLMAALGEMERGITGERIRAAMKHKRAMREKTGGDVPYGYYADEAGCLVENEREQEAIRLIFELNQKGYSLRRICRELEKKGYQTKTGRKTWNPKSVRGILRRAA